jgi:1-deoxy-D-xylulose-5-phosphate synthase
MPSGSSLKYMMAEMPDRALDVGICEQHAVTVSAGLATQGKKVFCHIYSSFMQRAYDQVVHDVAIQKLPVIFCLDRAGVAGDDGPTHHGAYDIAYMRCVPNMIVSAPMNESELRNLMFTAQLPEQNLPFSMRYPRGQGVMPHWETPLEKLEIGKGRKLQAGDDIAILSFGHPGNFVTDAISELEGISVAHYDMRFVKPIDEEILHEVGKKHTRIITIEDGTIVGGFGSACLEFFAQHNYNPTLEMLGMPDRIVEHGKQPQLWDECGYDAKAVVAKVKEMVAVELRVV